MWSIKLHDILEGISLIYEGLHNLQYMALDRKPSTTLSVPMFAVSLVSPDVASCQTRLVPFFRGYIHSTMSNELRG